MSLMHLLAVGHTIERTASKAGSYKLKSDGVLPKFAPVGRAVSLTPNEAATETADATISTARKGEAIGFKALSQPSLFEVGGEPTAGPTPAIEPQDGEAGHGAGGARARHDRDEGLLGAKAPFFDLAQCKRSAGESQNEWVETPRAAFAESSSAPESEVVSRSPRDKVVERGPFAMPSTMAQPVLAKVA